MAGVGSAAQQTAGTSAHAVELAVNAAGHGRAKDASRSTLPSQIVVFSDYRVGGVRWTPAMRRRRLTLLRLRS
jgi:hypothetical protein